MTDVHLSTATSAEDVAAVKAMFLAYQKALGVDLCFQGFDEEMATFPAKYDLLLIAKDDAGIPLGCVGLWTLEPGICEMKRLYIEPAARGKGVGRALCERLITQARALGFTSMKLDTLDRLKPAVALYRSMGFRQIPAYNVNPESDILYFEKPL